MDRNNKAVNIQWEKSYIHVDRIFFPQGDIKDKKMVDVLNNIQLEYLHDLQLIFAFPNVK